MINIDLPGLLFTCMMGALVYTAWLAVLMRSEISASEWLLAAFVCATSHILAMQVVLGLFYALTATTLAWVTAGSVVLMGFVAWRTRMPGMAQRRRDEMRVALRDITTSRAALAVLLLLAVLHLWIVFLAGIFPPFAYDEFYYHMPIVAMVIQDQTVIPAASSLTWIRAFPRYSELLSVWTSIFLHRDTFADLALVPFHAMGGLGLYIMARKRGATRAWGVLCAALWWFSPAIFIQAKSTYNDIMVGALWVMGICFIMPRRRADESQPRSTSQKQSVILAGLCAGMLAGTKISGVLFTAVLLALLLISLHLQHIRRRQMLSLAATLVCVAALSGSTWIVLNALATGNPFYPVPIRVLGREVLRGDSFMVNTATIAGEEALAARIPPALRHVSSWFDTGASFTIGERFTGFGPVWAIIGLPAILVATVLALRRRDGVHDTFIVALVALSVALLVLIPASWTPRYSLFVMAAGGLSLAALESQLVPRVRAGMSGLIVALSLFSMLLGLDFGSFDAARVKAFASLPDRERIASRWDAGSFGGAYATLDNLTATRSAKVAYAGFLLPYPLWGYSFNNHVVHVPMTDEGAYVDALLAAGVEYYIAPADLEETHSVAADPRATRIDDGRAPDGLALFALQP